MYKFSKFFTQNKNSTFYILYITAAFNPRFLVPKRRHSSVSLGNLATSNSESLQPSTFSIQEDDNDICEGYNRTAIMNANEVNSNNNNGNRSKLIFSNVTSIPIVLCGMLQSDIFAMARETPTVCDNNSPSGEAQQQQQQQQQQGRHGRKLYFNGVSDDNENNNDNQTGPLDEGSA